MRQSQALRQELITDLKAYPQIFTALGQFELSPLSTEALVQLLRVDDEHARLVVAVRLTRSPKHSLLKAELVKGADIGSGVVEEDKEGAGGRVGVDESVQKVGKSFFREGKRYSVVEVL